MPMPQHQEKVFDVAAAAVAHGWYRDNGQATAQW